MKKRPGNGFYVFTVLLFMSMLFVNFKYFKGSSLSNIGITDAKIYKINSERSGVIKNIAVVPGQEVQAGDLLVQMENGQLEIEIEKLKNRLQALTKEKSEKLSLLQARMAYLKAEGGIKVEGLEAEMVQINTEMALNQKLTQQFRPTESADLSNGLETAGNPQQLAVRSLQEKKKLHQEATAIKINEMKKGHAADILILENDIALKQKELELLLAEKKKLNKYANFNGVVESVFVRSGEQVEAFAPIISINPRHPSSIIGYMVGPKARPLAVGEKVTVTSYDHKNITATGKIIGFGAINELPEILQKTTAIKAFGREVFIKIPEENLFATGEKVLIK